MAKTAAKSSPLRKFSLKAAIFVFLMYSLYDHTRISNSSENIKNMVCVSGLSFLFYYMDKTIPTNGKRGKSVAK